MSKLLRDFELRQSLGEETLDVQNWGINVYFQQYVELRARVASHKDEG